MGASTSRSRLQNLPADLTSFVGREREVATLKGLLGKRRMVTLVGPGGVGKTRVALRTATEVGRIFPDGVWWVDLAALTDAALVAQTVADALRVQGLVPDRSADSLADYLRPRQLLLVLDNCEHLVDPCAALADSLLRSCPDVRILATSRQPLHVDGEHVLAVVPLATPPATASGGGDSWTCSPAVQLFAERAGAIQPHFELTPRNRDAVTEICRRLDGIPLAIELAAGRMRVLSVDQLRERLDNRFGLLAGSSPTTLPRQRTLRALIDWSFELCSPAEQLLWSRLSLFRDGFELDAVESVCVDELVSAADVLDVLAGLVDKSVIIAEPGDGHMRYALPETLAEYGRERLSETDEVTLRRKHRDWCQRLVNLAELGWFSDQQVGLFTRMRREHANVRLALGFCAGNPHEAETGLMMASSLRFYWVLNGSMTEGRHWLDRLLAQHSAGDATRLKALRVNAHLAVLLTDYAGADLLLKEATRLTEHTVGGGSARADVLQVQGLSALFQFRTEHAAELLGEAMEGHRQLDDVAALGYDAVQLALAILSTGDHDRALGLLEESLRICESSGESWTTSLAWFALSVAAVSNGDQARATHAGRQSIRLRRPLGDRRNIGLNFEALAWSAALAGDPERAARLFGAAQAVEEAIGTSMLAISYLAALRDRHEPVVRAALGDAGFERELRAGLRSSFDSALDYALGIEKHVANSREQPAAEAGLTKREWQIAQLVADGMSNRAIAAQLVISPRTVEAHVEHILAKLSFTSRTQVSSWMAQRRPSA